MPRIVYRKRIIRRRSSTNIPSAHADLGVALNANLSFEQFLASAPALGFSADVLLQLELALAASNHSLGFNVAALLTTTTGVELAAAPNLGITTNVLLTREAYLAAAAALGVNEVVSLYLEYELNASAALGANMAAQLQLERDLVVAEGLGVTQAVALQLEADLAAAAALGVTMAVTLYREQYLTAAPALGANMAATLTREAVFTTSPALGANMAATLQLERDLTAAPSLGLSAAVTLRLELALTASTALGASMAVALNREVGLPMPPQYVNTGGASISSGTTVTPALPSGRVNGNLLLAVIRWNSGATIAIPSGWNGPLNASGLTNCFWRIVDGTETAPVFTWTGTKQFLSEVFQYASVDTVTPFGGNHVNSGTGTALSTGNITTTTPGSMTISVFTADGGVAISETTGWVRDAIDTNIESLYLAHQTGPTPPALTGGDSASIGVSNAWSAYVYEINHAKLLPALGITMAAAVQLERDLAAAPALGVSMAATLTASSGPDITEAITLATEGDYALVQSRALGVTNTTRTDMWKIYVLGGE